MAQIQMGADDGGGLGGPAWATMWSQSTSISVNAAPSASRSASISSAVDIRRRGAGRPHQRGRVFRWRGNANRRVSSLQYDIIAGMLMRQPTRPSGSVDQVLVEFAFQLVGELGGDLAPRAGQLLGARLGAVGVVGRGQHRVGDLGHPGAVERHRRIQQHQTGDQVGPGRGQVAAPPRRRTNAPTTRTGPSASASSSAASASTLASMRPRRRPAGPAVADQIRCEHREVGQVPGGQRLPAPAVPGQSVHRQNLRRAGTGRSGTRGGCRSPFDARWDGGERRCRPRSAPLVGPP